MRYTARPALFSAKRALHANNADESPLKNFTKPQHIALSSSSVASFGQAKKLCSLGKA